MKLLLGDCIEKMKELEDNSVDSVVTDPPYFLTNSGGSGFMGKEWDSLSIGNAFAESVLKSLHPVWLMAEVSSVPDDANTPISANSKGKNIHALYVAPKCIAQNHKLNLGTFSVQESVLTRAEVLALSRELCPSLTSVLESQPENVLYVVSDSFTAKSPNGIAQELALKLHTDRICEELKTLHSLMADQDINGLIEAMSGNQSGLKFTSATSSNVENVESIVAEKRYNAIISSHIEFQKTIRWITSLRFVRNAMAIFMENPSNIQLLSERFHFKWLTEVFRVLKPGGHVLAFAGTRTYGRLAVAVEDAGFEIRDQIQWIYGSGFPKSFDISKAIDKAADNYIPGDVLPSSRKSDASQTDIATTFRLKTAANPQTYLAKKWQGWGTALKPANEPIVLARKPLIGTVAENVEKYGTGGLNIDESRIGVDSDDPNHRKPNKNMGSGGGHHFSFGRIELPNLNAQGRWPANVILDEVAAELLDKQVGHLSGAGNKIGSKKKAGSHFGDKETQINVKYDNGGSASRFFAVFQSTKHAIETACKTTNVNNVENGSLTTQEIELIAKTFFAHESAMPFLDLANRYLNVNDAELKSKNTEIDFAQSLAKALAKTESQLKACLAYIALRNELIPRLNHALNVALLENIGTITTIQNQLKLSGFASLVTESIITWARSGLNLECDQLRFAYQAKASKRERGQGNVHPTVKPIKLMQYLIKLVTPPQGVVLDPFMGSGSTGCAARSLGFKFIGCEMNQEYFEIAERRINGSEDNRV